MQQRPSMHARDSSGRQVSLLNDEPARSSNPHVRNTDYQYPPPGMIRSSSSHSTRSGTSSPETPGLIRADSYDSQNTSDAHSPLTPTYMADFGRHSSYTGASSYKENYEHPEPLPYGYPQHTPYTMSMPMRPYQEQRSSYTDPYSVSFEEDPYQPTKGGKRYPCRFKESHGCDRTFTTSGHASRHSKIHTAEKAVNCSHPGCPKKFTRADNMKQHLETHYKDRSRSNATQKAAATKSTLTVPAGIKKQGAPSNGRTSRTSNRGESRTGLPPMMDPALFDPQYAAPYNVSGVQEALVAQPMNSHSNGLDALAAAAVGFQHGQS